MIDLSTYADKHIAILGLGKTGVATANALHTSGATLTIWDDTPSACEALPVTLAQYVKPFADWQWERLDAVVVSPGVPLTHPKPHAAITLAQKYHVRITSDIELLYEACTDAIYVGITGTNGKSTTTSLIGHMLKEAGKDVQVGGNIGTPALAMSPLDAGGIYVIELSSYQLDLVNDVRMNVAVWLNISPDHLDRHGDMEGYINAKRHIFDHQTADDTAVICVDDAYSESVAHALKDANAQKVIPCSVTQKMQCGLWVKDGVVHDEETIHDLNACTHLQGEHNHQNAVAAFAACRALGVDAGTIIKAMHSYGGLAHRMQQVTEHDGVRFVNDSKATNADAAEKSLKTYEAIFWIVGGVAKAGGIDSLSRYFVRIKHAFLIGEAQDAFAQTLEGHVPYVRCDSLQHAVQSAYMQAKGVEGAVVLLAPACASFDQFPNFEARGDAFVDAVKEITDAG